MAIVGNLTVNAGGFVSPNSVDPGVTTGNLSAKNTVFAAGSKLSVQLKGASVGDYDSLTISGTINLGNATLAATLNFAPSKAKFLPSFKMTELIRWWALSAADPRVRSST